MMWVGWYDVGGMMVVGAWYDGPFSSFLSSSKLLSSPQDIQLSDTNSPK